MSVKIENSFSNFIYRFRYHFFLCLIITIAVVNLTIDIMEIDAAQYASIALEMSQNGSYLHVYSGGADYLDKPPLLFWLSSISISILGNTNIAYKLPAVLLLIFALWATYGFAKLWYGHHTGIIAVLILGSTQAFHLMTNDVRTDGLLTSFIILSVWCLSLYLKEKKIIHLISGGFCIGIAMLSKGPIGIVIPFMAIGGHLILTSQWKKMIDPSWLLLFIPVIFVLAPMCYGLYTQFDLHPEKVFSGHNGISGIGFYFWTQSFGRITGMSHWHNNAPWYFFFQTILWDLQPWVLIFIPAMMFKIKSSWGKWRNNDDRVEWITFSGFVFPFIALSMSNYKLPHYIFPLFPFAAIISAVYLIRFADKLPRWFEYLQLTLLHFFFVLSLLIFLWAFPTHTIFYFTFFILFYFLFWWHRLKSENAVDRWLLPSLVSILFFQLILSLHFYPNILKYQSSGEAGKYIAAEKPKHVYCYDKSWSALDYYSGFMVPEVVGHGLDTLSVGSWVYLPSKDLGVLPPYRIIHTFDEFRVTQINLGFVNPKTRSSKLKHTYLVELTGK